MPHHLTASCRNEEVNVTRARQSRNGNCTDGKEMKGKGQVVTGLS